MCPPVLPLPWVLPNTSSGVPACHDEMGVLASHSGDTCSSCIVMCTVSLTRRPAAALMVNAARVASCRRAPLSVLVLWIRRLNSEGLMYLSSP
jgi:hypothetical protein